MSVLVLLRPIKSTLKRLIRGTQGQFGRAKYYLPLNDSQWAKLDLLKTLIQRDMEARHKGSIFGNLWPLLTQLAQLLTYTYVFAIVLQVKLSLKGMPADNSFVFGLWLFAGLLPWIAFSTGLNRATRSVTMQPNLVKKVVFPLTLLPLVPVFTSFLESTLGLAALIVFTAIVNQNLPPTLLLLPFVWLPQLLFTIGLGLLTASLTVFIRDIPQTLGIILNLWFYATPIIYPAKLIPEPFQYWVFRLNPMAVFSEIYRNLVLLGNGFDWSNWLAATGISIAMFFCGLACYRKLSPAFADVL